MPHHASAPTQPNQDAGSAPVPRLGVRRVLLCVLLGIALSVGAVPVSNAATVHHWTITTAKVGKVSLTETLSQLRRAGYSYYPCGGASAGHPCYFKGALGRAGLEFDVNAHNRVKEIMVTSAAGSGYAFATSSGISVGSTVAKLKNKEHPRFVSSYGYGPSFQVHTSRHNWLTFFVTGTTSTSTVWTIVTSSYTKPVPGR